LIKNSQPFRKNVRKPQGGDFFTHTVYIATGREPRYLLLSFTATFMQWLKCANMFIV